MLTLLLAFLFLPFQILPGAGIQSRLDPAVLKSLAEAKAALQTAVDTWNPKLMAEARDGFLGCLLRDKTGNAYLPYYVALSDYRLATFNLSKGSAAESDSKISEGEAYLDQALKAAPLFGDALGLYGYMIGLEIANHPDRAMALSMKSYEYFDRAAAAEGSNPRVFLLRGIYQRYVPEAFGGGPDSALEYLNKAIALFEKENISDPRLPSWGRDEALTNAALAYKQKGDKAKAIDLLKQALAVNPNCGQAKDELAAIDQ